MLRFADPCPRPLRMESNTTDPRDRILKTARDLIRRFGGAKTNVVDIAQAMGLSHSAIYRHFRSKAEIFDALAALTMAEEAALAETFVKADAPAAERLAALVLTLHRSKRVKLADDPEMHALYRRIVEERPDLISDYARRMTGLLRLLLADGVARGSSARWTSTRRQAPSATPSQCLFIPRMSRPRQRPDWIRRQACRP